MLLTFRGTGGPARLLTLETKTSTTIYPLPHRSLLTAQRLLPRPALAAQCEIPTHIAQYLFKIVSQRAYRTHFAFFSCDVAEALLRYTSSSSAHARGRGIAPNLFILRHPNGASWELVDQAVADPNCSRQRQDNKRKLPNTPILSLSYRTGSTTAGSTGFRGQKP